MKQAAIFVDGENFRQSIVELFWGEFDKEEYLPKHADWVGFFNWLVSQLSSLGLPHCERLRTYWYVINDLEFSPYKFPNARADGDKLNRVLSSNPRIKEELSRLSGTGLTEKMEAIVKQLHAVQNQMKNRFDGWRKIQNGIATAHFGIEFRRAGAIRYDLFEKSLGSEKAVDVKLASDMIVLKDIYDVAIIVTGDQDYVPAVEIIKDFGKRVINVSFKTRGSKSLPGGSRRLNAITDGVLEAAYSDLKGFLKIGASTPPCP